MELPELYRKVAFLPKRDASKTLEEFTYNGRWKKNARIIDFGCGDGSTTSTVLAKHAPSCYNKILGCDVSVNMVGYANRHFRSDRIEFAELDMVKELPDHLTGVFDHAFCSYALQRIIQQEAAFQSIYRSLKVGGNCLLLFFGRYPVYDVFRALSRKDKWTEALKDVETFISPYHDSQDPECEVTSLMRSVGFKEVQVNIFENTHTYYDEDTFKNLIKAINPFRALNDRWDEFMNDYFELTTNTIKIDYQLIVAYGLK